MVIWSGQYGYLVNMVIWWSCHLIIWSSGHHFIWSPCHLIIWSIWSSGHLVNLSSGHLVIWSSGHLVIWSFTILWKTVLFFWNTGIICPHSESCFGDLIEQSGYLVYEVLFSGLANNAPPIRKLTIFCHVSFGCSSIPDWKGKVFQVIYFCPHKVAAI